MPRQNLAAVSYHFGNKNALVHAMLTRRLDGLNAARLDALDRIEAALGEALTCEHILGALFLPALQRARSPETSGPALLRLLGRAYTDPAPFIVGFLSERYSHGAQRFFAAFQRALPHLPREELGWRLHFFIGSISRNLASPDTDQLIRNFAQKPAARRFTTHRAARAADGRRTPGTDSIARARVPVSIDTRRTARSLTRECSMLPKARWKPETRALPLPLRTISITPGEVVMTTLIVMFVIAFLVVSGALIFVQAPALAWLAWGVAWVAAGWFAHITGPVVTTLLTLVFVLPAVVLAVKPLRRALITQRVFALFRKILPVMSATERDAIEAGTVWWDAALFSGKPDWDTLLGYGAPTLTAQEQSFIDNECTQLCDLANDWDTTVTWQDLSPESWAFIKSKGFLGMIIPTQYGGKAFSAYAHSQVIMKLATRCSAAAVSVMVPNSLGPAELLMHYGTEAQKNHYLPRLARGDEIPCFALTSPYAGSDAAAIPDVGIVCKGMHEGHETLGFRVTWDKRYITLGPIATVLGLAFRALDPDHLLGTADEAGITCALIPTTHPGVTIGRRHWPLNAVFQNGPNSGRDVFIPMEWVIGGRDQVGNGWRMLMECLAAGRAISLPSSNVGMAKLAVRSTGAYAAARRQFRTAINKFEGVQEVLGRMGGNLYVMDAARKLSAQAVDLGEKPSVISAIAKYHITERARNVINDGMDVVAGKGICMGPSNFLARAYQQVPISITVEGANILTRSLIIFGQGAIRCHPYVLKEMAATRETDRTKALHAFDNAFFGHASFTASNVVRSLVFAFGGAALIPRPKRADPRLARYYRAATRLSTAFALLADTSMFVLGGELKRRERLSARLGDILSQLYLISATLKRFEDDGRPDADLPFVQWGVEDALYKAQTAFDGVLANYPARAAAGIVRALAFPFGLPHRVPGDRLGTAIALAMTTPGDARERLIADSYAPHVEVDALGYGELLFALSPRYAAIEHKLREPVKAKQLTPMPQSLPDLDAWAADCEARGFIDASERQILADYARYGEQVVKVDDFPADFGMLEALKERQRALGIELEEIDA